MIGFLRLAVIGFVNMTIAYVMVLVYSRSVRREKLEKEWDANPPEGADDAAREAYIEKGMAEYETGLKRKLIWLVYVLPITIALVLLYLNNFY